LGGWKLRKRRYNRTFFNIHKQYMSMALQPASAVEKYRDLRIREFVKHASITVPYYKARFAEFKIGPEDIEGLDDLKCLPILTKDQVQANLPLLKSEAFSERETITTRTSGTTGRGLVFPTTVEAERRQWAIWWRFRNLNGIEFDTPCGVFGGKTIVPVNQSRPPFWRYDRPGKHIFFSGYHLKKENLQAYISQIKKSGIRWLHGYPSNLTLIASFIIETGVKMAGQIKYITTGAESLLVQQKSILEKAFSAKVFQHYGLAEAVANFSECPQGRLHVDEDFAGVELIPTGGNLYSIVGTNFTNYAFPLLRYHTGDIAYVSPDQKGCSCGWPGRTIDWIDGRIEDYIVLNDGTRIGRLDHLFKDMTAIREAQIFQDEPGKVQFRIVRAPEYSISDEGRLLRAAGQRIGNNISIEIKYADELKRSATGKLRFVINKLADGKISADQKAIVS
jgi:phenylacetate-CoA ligase